ncbi:NgoPII family restriction endonuclease [Campylobacter sp. CX2-4080-23]|uniref:NgoPII family restriction endonuclease n=1 Tax=Campylobacter porcelli TaxID=1660073 RepID=UPI002EA9877F|nr:NgoPII family restriction endonuclease [Campylobacter sp. CX2-4080-23]
MSNIIDAICNLLKNKPKEIKAYYNKNNRANSMGDSLENFISDLFCDTVLEADESKKLLKKSEVFSYIGNNNNPPDFMLRGGDAIEVKKIENANSTIALNSSYPKVKLFANSQMITTACKNCEDWTQKDMIYSIGVMEKNLIKSLIFVYGIDYAASCEVYDKIKNVIQQSIETIAGVKFAQTKELGRVNKVDPLGITYLRIRGMWHIENPLKVFNYVFKKDVGKDFTFISIINDEKFKTFRNADKLLNLIEQTDGAKISDIFIKEPDNPAKIKKAKLITYEF